MALARGQYRMLLETRPLCNAEHALGHPAVHLKLVVRRMEKLDALICSRHVDKCACHADGHYNARRLMRLCSFARAVGAPNTPHWKWHASRRALNGTTGMLLPALEAGEWNSPRGRDDIWLLAGALLISRIIKIDISLIKYFDYISWQQWLISISSCRQSAAHCLILNYAQI